MTYQLGDACALKRLLSQPSAFCKGPSVLILAAGDKLASLDLTSVCIAQWGSCALGSSQTKVFSLLAVRSHFVMEVRLM